MVFNYKRLAKKNSYKTKNGKAVKRSVKDIEYIVIHYTGGTKDTAKNEADYFATGNYRSAGAHSFVDKNGLTSRSVYMTYTAWSVGDSSNGRGAYYGKCTNANSVSIELCGIAGSEITDSQLKALKKLIRYYGKKCPNINNIIRHYDVTTKRCPDPYCGNTKKDAKWQALKSELMLELKKVRA